MNIEDLKKVIFGANSGAAALPGTILGGGILTTTGVGALHTVEFTPEDKKELENLEADLFSYRKQGYIDSFKLLPCNTREEIIQEGEHREFIERWEKTNNDSNFPDITKLRNLRNKKDLSRGSMLGGMQSTWVSSGYSAPWNTPPSFPIKYAFIFNVLTLDELKSAHVDVLMEETLRQ